jgi:hypothetical protein
VAIIHVVVTEKISVVLLFLSSGLFLSFFLSSFFFIYLFIYLIFLLYVYFHIYAFLWSSGSPITLTNQLCPGVRDSNDGTEIPFFPHVQTGLGDPVNLVCDVYWKLDTGNKRSEPEADHLMVCSIEVKNARSHTPIS